VEARSVPRRVAWLRNAPAKDARAHCWVLIRNPIMRVKRYQSHDQWQAACDSIVALVVILMRVVFRKAASGSRLPKKKQPVRITSIWMSVFWNSSKTAFSSSGRLTQTHLALFVSRATCGCGLPKCRQQKIRHFFKAGFCRRVHQYRNHDRLTRSALPTVLVAVSCALLRRPAQKVF